MFARACLVLVLLTACSTEGGGGSSDAGSSSTIDSGSTGAAGSSTDGGQDISGTSEGADTSTGSSTGDDLQGCGLAELAPGAMNPIQSGTGAMQIPPDIAAIQAANCGCHLSDDVVPMTPDYPAIGPFDMTTWAGFQALREGDMMPYHAIALGYVESEFMPLSSFCSIGGGLHMDADDRATLIAWLTAGAPDGASWMP